MVCLACRSSDHEECSGQRHRTYCDCAHVTGAATHGAYWLKRHQERMAEGDMFDRDYAAKERRRGKLVQPETEIGVDALA